MAGLRSDMPRMEFEYFDGLAESFRKDALPDHERDDFKRALEDLVDTAVAENNRMMKDLDWE